LGNRCRVDRCDRGDRSRKIGDRRGAHDYGTGLWSRSKNPFLQGDDNGQPAIRPNESFEVPLANDVSETTVELPEALRQGNILVAADSGSRKLLKVLDATTRKPLPKTYIKVFAEMNSGEIVFHKDGYTDLRGKFDYLSHTGIDPSTVKRVAVLVSHPNKGARTVIYDR
jgi:hypothetical protein